MFNQFGPIVKNLLLLNIALFIIDFALRTQGIDLGRYLALHGIHSPFFKPYQFITHMFMHGDILHLFFNMYALVLFGPILERIWGKQRFFIFYFSCGIFAGLLTAGINAYSFYQIKPMINELVINQIYFEVENSGYNLIPVYEVASFNKLVHIIASSSVGASGAIFGILAAFAWLFPNTELQLIFPPIPVKAKWLIGIYLLFEIYSAFIGSKDGIDHWAHIGGAIMGTIFIFIWKQNKKSFY